MQFNRTPDPQELVDAIAMSIDRDVEISGGRTVLWCPSKPAQALRRAIPRRDKAIPGVLMQAARLIRLMDRSERAGYTSFLYIRMPALRTRLFATVFEQAMASGALDGIAEPYGDRGLRLIEQEMNSAEGAPFNLHYAQMPGIAACIDILHNMIGFERVAALCAGVIGKVCTGTAIETGVSLRQEMDAWMHPRLPKEHFAKQSEVLRKYMEANNIAAPEAINDEVVFEFWAKDGSLSKVDGFKKFRNSARHVLAYRSAMMAARAEESSEHALPLFEGDAAELVVHGDAANAGVQHEEAWVSPLAVLFSPPSNRVKWLVGTDRQVLTHLIAQPLSEDEQGKKTQPSASLFVDTPPNTDFYRTVLRFSFFGALQELMIANGYELARDLAPAEFSDYPQIAGYFRKRDALILACMRTAAWMLLRKMRQEGMALCVYLAPERIAKAFEDIDQAEIDRLHFVGDAETFRLQRFISLTDDAGRDIFAILEPLERGRSGFRKGEEEDPEVIEALAEGSDAIERLHRHIQHYAAWLDRQDLTAMFRHDREMFDAQFRRLYLE